MNKYIDVGKLKAEIERYKQGAAIARFDNAGENADYFQGKVDLCDDLTHLIASLQQEKSKKDCNGCPHCVDRKDQFGWHFKGCFGGPYNGKFIAEIDECPLKQEQQGQNFEKEEFVGVAESPLKTFPRVNDFECGGGYRR